MATQSAIASARPRSERLAILALFVGALAIAFSPIFVRLSELGPTATAFHRVALAIPVLWLALVLDFAAQEAASADALGEQYAERGTRRRVAIGSGP